MKMVNEDDQATTYLLKYSDSMPAGLPKITQKQLLKTLGTAMETRREICLLCPYLVDGG